MGDTLNNQYTCACCHGAYDKGWTEEEAEKELGENFPDHEKEDCDIVCDDCYRKFWEWQNAPQAESHHR